MSVSRTRPLVWGRLTAPFALPLTVLPVPLLLFFESLIEIFVRYIPHAEGKYPGRRIRALAISATWPAIASGRDEPLYAHYKSTP
jgi:hypothetical protein